MNRLRQTFDFCCVVYLAFQTCVHRRFWGDYLWRHAVSILREAFWDGDNAVFLRCIVSHLHLIEWLHRLSHCSLLTIWLLFATCDLCVWVRSLGGICCFWSTFTSQVKRRLQILVRGSTQESDVTCTFIRRRISRQDSSASILFFDSLTQALNYIRSSILPTI